MSSCTSIRVPSFLLPPRRILKQRYDSEKYDWCITARARDEELCYVLEHYDTKIKKLPRSGERARVSAANLSIDELNEAAGLLSDLEYIRVI